MKFLTAQSNKVQMELDLPPRARLIGIRYAFLVASSLLIGRLMQYGLTERK